MHITQFFLLEEKIRHQKLQVMIWTKSVTVGWRRQRTTDADEGVRRGVGYNQILFIYIIYQNNNPPEQMQMVTPFILLFKVFRQKRQF